MSKYNNFTYYDEKDYSKEFETCCSGNLYHCIQYYLNDGYIPTEENLRVTCMNSVSTVETIKLLLDSNNLTDYDKYLSFTLESNYYNERQKEIFIEKINFWIELGAKFTIGDRLTGLLHLDYDTVKTFIGSTILLEIVNGEDVYNYFMNNKFEKSLELFGDMPHLMTKEHIINILKYSGHYIDNINEFDYFIGMLTDVDDFQEVLDYAMSYNYVNDNNYYIIKKLVECGASLSLNNLRKYLTNNYLTNNSINSGYIEKLLKSDLISESVRNEFLDYVKSNDNYLYIKLLE